MARPRTKKLELSTEEEATLAHLETTVINPRLQQRLRFLRYASRGPYTLASICNEIGCSPDTARRWAKLCTKERVKGLLELALHPGPLSAVATPNLWPELMQAINSQKVTNPEEAVEFLKKHGVQMTAKTLQRRLKAAGVVFRLRRIPPSKWKRTVKAKAIAARNKFRSPNERLAFDAGWSTAVYAGENPVAPYMGKNPPHISPCTETEVTLEIIFDYLEQGKLALEKANQYKDGFLAEWKQLPRSPR